VLRSFPNNGEGSQLVNLTIVGLPGSRRPISPATALDNQGSVRVGLHF
jgi:hypothetical protein